MLVNGAQNSVDLISIWGEINVQDKGDSNLSNDEINVQDKGDSNLSNDRAIPGNAKSPNNTFVIVLKQ